MAIKMKDNKSSLATSFGIGIGIFSFNQIIAILSTVELSQFEVSWLF